MPDFSIYSNPWTLAILLVMPLAIIGLAKSWKRFKDKRREKEQATSSN